MVKSVQIRIDMLDKIVMEVHIRDQEAKVVAGGGKYGDQPVAVLSFRTC